jgi:hypothetical protein
MVVLRVGGRPRPLYSGHTDRVHADDGLEAQYQEVLVSMALKITTYCDYYVQLYCFKGELVLFKG